VNLDYFTNKRTKKTTMKKNNLFHLLSSVAALFLLASCSSDDETVSSVVPATPNVPVGTIIHYVATVSGATDTRATLSGSKQYEYQTGDVLRITGTDISGDLSLTAGAGTANATFEGDLTYTGSGTPANDLELHAVLVGISNQMTTLTYASAEYPTTAIASSLSDAVEQYSHFTATSTYAAKAFSMAQQTSFLNFTVTLKDGTAAGTALDITINNGGSAVRTGSVTTVSDGGVKAKFVAALPAGTTMSSANFQLGTKNAVSFGGTTTLVANKIYNISKIIDTPGQLTGTFTINASGDQAYFSQGNLQATWDGTSWTWAFATNQWDFIGDTSGNTSLNGDGTVSASNVTVDLFGWVGESSTLTGVAQYGISNSGAFSTYGNAVTDELKSDWGNTIGAGWRTLTSDEWKYLFKSRASGSTFNGTSNARYTYAIINTDGTSVHGIILFPDGVDIASSEVTTAGTVNDISDWGTRCTTAQWEALAAKGCVFLPAAGSRNGTTVSYPGTRGAYWSSSSCAWSHVDAFGLTFYSASLNSQNQRVRYYGSSVRLVSPVE
jgi:hypothetical protein